VAPYPCGESGTGTAQVQQPASTYHGVMGNVRDQLREHVAMFFTNWRNPDYTFVHKLGLTVKNRSLGLVRGGCCGNHGQPGC
jgi:hypothetical protein